MRLSNLAITSAPLEVSGGPRPLPRGSPEDPPAGGFPEEIMKIALAQIRSIVGNLQANVEKIVTTAKKGAEMGGEIVLFPELSLIGSPPHDLLRQSTLIEKSLAALNEAARQIPQVAVVVGFADQNPLPEGRPLYNSAALLEGGEIQHIVYKSHVPRFEWFDQTRYFEPSLSVPVIKFRGVRLAILIGEDVWTDSVSGIPLGFARSLPGEIAKKKVDVILCPAAWPYAPGGDRKRVEIVRAQVAKNKIPIVVCNAVGGSDEWVFDGASFGVSSSGEPAARARAFEEDLILFDTKYGAGDVREELPELDQTHRALVRGIRDYADGAGFRRAVVPVLGDMSSAAVACLAVEALGKDHVTLVSLPAADSAPDLAADSQKLAASLGTPFVQMNLEPAADALIGIIHGAGTGERGASDRNLRSRMRAAVVTALGKKLGAIPLSSLTRSELMTGIHARNGEAEAGVAPLGDLPRSLVATLAKECLNRDREVIPESILRRRSFPEPAALPEPEVTDRILDLILEGMSAEQIAGAGFDRAAVDKICSRVAATEYKRVGRPPILRIGTPFWKTGRRMPLNQGR